MPDTELIDVREDMVIMFALLMTAVYGLPQDAQEDDPAA